MSRSRPSPRRVLLMAHKTYPPCAAAAIAVVIAGVFPRRVPTCNGRVGSAIRISAAAWRAAVARWARHVQVCPR
ncbi:Uncharacterised protein [Mycobacteroides abscessus subsp. abscessus]|nr:Uncharacterised protein [Mycobacteroides abscessus subsp. abscessus]